MAELAVGLGGCESSLRGLKQKGMRSRSRVNSSLVHGPKLWHVTNPPFQPRISEDNAYSPHSGVERQDSLKAAGFRE
jgi:hypothetical protein